VSRLTLDPDPTAQLAAQLVEAGDRVLDLDTTHADAAELLASGSRPPRRSGRLAAAVRADVGPNGWVVGYPIRYATYVHWGAPARNVRAQPWLLQAATAETADLERLYTEHTATALHST
jgi:hypothetical protein